MLLDLRLDRIDQLEDGSQLIIDYKTGKPPSAAQVKAGFALAFEEQSDDYVVDMVDAITAGVGLWQVGVEFEEPWLFRRRETPGGLR